MNRRQTSLEPRLQERDINVSVRLMPDKQEVTQAGRWTGNALVTLLLAKKN